MEKLATYIVREGPLAAHDAVGWVARLAATLEPIHGLGVSHGRVSAKALQIEDPACTTAGYLLDTADLTDDPAYYSMDRTEGGPRSPESDVWAVGVTLYQLLTGTLPFPGTTARAVKRRLLGPPPAPLAVFDVGDDKLQRILDRLLARNPAERLTNIGELRKLLEDFEPLAATLPPLSYGKPGDSDEDDGWEDEDSEDGDQLTAVRELPAELLRAVGEIKRREAVAAASESQSGARVPPPHPSSPSSPGLAGGPPPAPREPSEDIDVLHDVYDEETQLEEDIIPSFDEESSDDEELDADARLSAELFGDAVVTAPDEAPARPSSPDTAASRPKPSGPPRRPPPPPPRGPQGGAKPAAPAKPAARPMFPPAEPKPAKPAPKPAKPAPEPAKPAPEPAKPAAAAAPKPQPERKPAPPAPAQAVPAPIDSKPRVPLPSSSADALLVSAVAPKPKTGRKVLLLVLLVVAGAGGALFVLHDPLALGLHAKLRQLWSSVAGSPAPTADPVTPSATSSQVAPAASSTPTAATAVVAGSASPSASAASSASSATSAASNEPPAASASAAASSSAAASGTSAPAAPPGDLRACVETFFPQDTFVGRTPKLGFLCETSNPLKGSVELRTQVVLCGGGPKGVTDGMHEWSTMGWYGMAAFVVIRSGCCESPTPIKAPKTVAKCDFDTVLTELGKTVHGSDDGAAEQAVKAYTDAIHCLARGGAARLFDQSGFPKGGELTTFKKVFKRARQRAKR